MHIVLPEIKFVGDGRRRCFSIRDMDFDGGIPMSRSMVTVGVSSSLSPPLDEDVLWQLNLRSSETMESGSYPVREGEPDCSLLHQNRPV
ncbi:hypothetical protein E3N88_44448 [Mikania micrantha]|uniref:Uncharacterized protein n=1 Tax=Mikania micrantha TaxID=192012 RepID=A0A5N6LED2_9ASTR|nr:hypothetical protein E3N88_44448 [Mikania micrantha]